MESHSSFRKIPFGAAKLCQDIATLVNNRQDSDIQFKVGGCNASTQENGRVIYDDSTTMTFYAHSLILRCRSSYFATMLDKEKNWKENSTGVIYKPNISPSTFQDVLHYIYTGSVCAKAPENIIELIAAADEMDLEELSTECQAEFIRTVKDVLSAEGEGSPKERIPIDVVVRTHIIPALSLANNHSLSNLFQEMLIIILPRMSVIVKSPGAYYTFVDRISLELLVKIIGSDDLTMTESNVWDLALSWGCHRTKLSKTAVEACLSSFNNIEGDNEELSDGTIISNAQLSRLKETLTPLLPSIRFSFLDPEYYKCISNILAYFLSRHQFSEISRFFGGINVTKPFDVPRVESIDRSISSKITINYIAWKLLRENIFKIGGIGGCHSPNDLKFELLFRASEHGFLASVFHQRCDNKGPTLVIVRSSDGQIFGGVNFNHWKSDFIHSSSIYNFLFVLPNGHHRKDSAIFKINSCYNSPNWGPYFDSDLIITNSADVNRKSCSTLPYYNENRLLKTGKTRYFRVSDYEVFAISISE